MDDRTLKLIADTLVEILAEMKRNRPVTQDIKHDPSRVHQVALMKKPSAGMEAIQPAPLVAKPVGASG